MNADPELAAVLPNLRRRREQAQARFDEARREINSLDLAIQGIEGLLPEEAAAARGGLEPVGPPARPLPRREDASSNGHPVGIEAVRQALESAEKGLTVEELTAAVARLGWIPDTNEVERAVRAAANRLRKQDTRFDYFAKHYIFRPKHIGTLSGAESEQHTPRFFGGPEP